MGSRGALPCPQLLFTITTPDMARRLQRSAHTFTIGTGSACAARRGFIMLLNDQTGNRQADGDILHPGSRALFRHWETIRAERAAPDHDDLDLTQVKAIVPDLFLLERDHLRDGFRYRLAGTRICQLFHHELTRSDVLAGWDQFERDTLRRLLATTVSSMQPCVLRLRLHSNLDHVIGVEMLCLPMVARDKSRIHILGGLFPFRDINGLGYERITLRELTGARTIWTEHAAGNMPLTQAVAPRLAPPRPFTVITGGRT